MVLIRELCATCPVLASCRTSALLRGDGQFGWLAGLSGPSSAVCTGAGMGITVQALPTVEELLGPLLRAKAVRVKRIGEQLATR